MEIFEIFNVGLFRIDNLSSFIGIFIGFFSVLTFIYSAGFMRNRKGKVSYYIYLILTVICSLGAVYSDNLLLFITFWGFTGALLYLLIEFGRKENSSYTAKKAFIIIGASDAFMLLGLGILWNLTGTLAISEMKVPLESTPAIWAYLCLAVGAFAKAGAMPFHSWVPDTAEDAPTPVTAYLPASLDKLLGIYLLVRMSLEIFIVSSAINIFLMAIGSFTILAAVMMALIQHDFKRLLGYHAVSQVGYMVLGIGTGSMLGMAGGLFHMLNHAIYKSCLFYSSGDVEYTTKTTDLEKLGGIGKLMPLTFGAFLVAAFSISGVPPFNGFFSKWMIYQAVIELGKNGGFLWIIWLSAAVFGSALTLASFMKLTHSVFLGQLSEMIQKIKSKIKEVGPLMWIPPVVLAVLCIVFGIFAYEIPIKQFIAPTVGIVGITGIWDPAVATILIIVGIVLGILIYFLSQTVTPRETDIFVGGEESENFPEMRVSGTEFYNSIRDMAILRKTYQNAERKNFDIYEVCSKVIFAFNRVLKYLHNGVLPTYLVWCLIGVLILFLILLI